MGFKEFGLDYGNPDFVQYARSYGAEGHRLESTDQLAGFLKNCLAAPGIHLVDVPIDYSENERVLIEELNAITCII